MALADPATAPAEGAILVVGPAWVGDMVLAQALFKRLKQHDPRVAIDVLAPSWTAPILDRMIEVRSVLASPFQHGELALRKRLQFARTLRGNGYQQAIVLPNSFKSALIPFFAGIPLRTGYRGEFRHGVLNDVRLLDEARLPRMVDRFVALVGDAREAIVNPQLKTDRADQARTLDTLGIKKTGPVAALCIGAEYGPAKRWPAEHFASLIELLSAQGWQCWLVGSAKDREMAAEIGRLGKAAALDLCGRTSLDQAVDVLASADVVIANDSGLMHVAAALNKPLIALYGSSSPAFTPPMSDHASIMRRDIPCSPCFARECPLGHFKCMRELLPEAVAQGVLAAKRSAGV